MRGSVAAALAGLRNRDDSEHEQALIRLAISGLVLVYLLGAMSISADVAPASAALPRALATVLAETAVALALVLGILAAPAPSHARRYLGMCADFATLALLMILYDRELAPLYIVSMLAVIANGLRYGIRALAAASALAGMSFLAVICNSAYWSRNPALAWGLLAGLVAIPAYLSMLLRAYVEANDDARRADEAKTRFLARMREEALVPLNGIVSWSDLLAATRLSHEQRECAESIQTAARSLRGLVDEVLDTAAIESGNLHRVDADFSLNHLLFGIQTLLHQPAASKNLRFDIEIADSVPDTLHGDAAQLRQILVNLLGNAIKFTASGAVSLRVETLDRRQAETCIWLRFSVVDTGIGMSEQARRLVFKPDGHVDASQSRRFGGSGLGATVARALTESAGGSLSFESEEGRGSTFRADIPFKLPAASREDAAVAPIAAVNVIAFDDPFVRHRARVKPMCLLVGDGNAASRMVLRRMLEKAGHRVEEVADTDAAVQAMKQTTFDAALLDLRLPGAGCAEALRRVRSTESEELPVPLILLRTDADPDAVREGERMNACATLVKPIAARPLLDALAQIADPLLDRQEVPASAQVGVIAPGTLEDLFELELGRDFMKLFVGECIRDATKCLADLDRHGAEGDWDGFREACRALKGVAGNVGAIRLAASASEITRLAAGPLATQWRAKTAELGAHLDAARAALHEAIAQSSREQEGGESG
jgi:two-component system sensor histidine kinase RpfC